MMRFARLFAVVVTLVFGSLLATARLGSAQDGTPTAQMPEDPGVTFTPLGFAPSVKLPDPADLILIRMVVEPGAVSHIHGDDPSNTLVLIESGSLTIQIAESPIVVTRGAPLAAMMATPEADMSGAMEMVPAGTSVTLNEGDVAFVPGNVSGEARNDGSDPVSALLFNAAPSGMMGGGETGTPTASS